nr:tetratricopeptide repeat protein [Myxococcota bacterium]
ADIRGAKLCLAAPAQRPTTTSPELAAGRAPIRAGMDEVSTLSALGQYQQALEKLDELIARAPANDPAAQGELLYRKADAMSRTGDSAGSVAVLEQALAIAERAGNDVARLNTIIMLLSAYAELGKTDEARALAKIAEAAAERVPRDPSVASRLATVLGALAYNRGDHAEAERHYREVVRLTEERHGAKSALLAGSLHNLGLAVHMAGRRAEAIEIQERSLAMFEATVGPAHPDVALPVTDLAGLALELRQLDRAVKLYRRGLAIREQALGAEHPHLTEALTGLARAERDRGNHDEALALLQRARTIGTAGFGEHHPLVAVAEFRIAEELDRRGDREAALAMVEHSVAAWDDNGVEVPDASYARFLLAKYRWRAGRRAEARVLARRAHAALSQLAAPYANTAKEVERWIATH